MTSKLTFRARTLDSSKPMAIYHAEQLPELAEASNINRAVTSLPTGMEKEEETEKHLQDILEAQNKGLVQKDELIIPTPEVLEQDQGIDGLYKTDFKQPRQYIHVQPFSTGQDMPDYDMDEEDIKFFKEELKNRRKLEVSMITFEDMIDRLEKNSSQVVVTLKEAKLLLKEDDELILAVYDFWLNKRLEKQQSLMPVVRQERRDGTQLPSPYVAFRRRTEKMQTRKNRKNDEASYEAMLKLRRDLSTAVTLLEMVKRREKTKKEKLALNSEVFEKRYVLKDWEGKLITEILAAKPARVLQSYCNVPSWIGTIGSPQISAQVNGSMKKSSQHLNKHDQVEESLKSTRGLSHSKKLNSCHGASENEIQELKRFKLASKAKTSLCHANGNQLDEDSDQASNAEDSDKASNAERDKANSRLDLEVEEDSNEASNADRDEANYRLDLEVVEMKTEIKMSKASFARIGHLLPSGLAVTLRPDYLKALTMARYT